MTTSSALSAFLTFLVPAALVLLRLRAAHARAGPPAAPPPPPAALALALAAQHGFGRHAAIGQTATDLAQGNARKNHRGV
jgi:hypothetical protein